MLSPSLQAVAQRLGGYCNEMVCSPDFSEVTPPVVRKAWTLDSRDEWCLLNGLKLGEIGTAGLFSCTMTDVTGTSLKPCYPILHKKLVLSWSKRKNKEILGCARHDFLSQQNFNTTSSCRLLKPPICWHISRMEIFHLCEMPILFVETALRKRSVVADSTSREFCVTECHF